MHSCHWVTYWAGVIGTQIYILYEQDWWCGSVVWWFALVHLQRPLLSEGLLKRFFRWLYPVNMLGADCSLGWCLMCKHFHKTVSLRYRFWSYLSRSKDSRPVLFGLTLREGHVCRELLVPTPMRREPIRDKVAVSHRIGHDHDMKWQMLYELLVCRFNLSISPCWIDLELCTQHVGAMTFGWGTLE